MSKNKKSLVFLRSALTEQNPFNDTASLLEWLRTRNSQVRVKIDKIKFNELKQWGFQEDTGNLVHESGKFFSIKGIQVKTNWCSGNEWNQPIISQPEIGFLGIITKQFDGVLYFLMQAKIEPGNVNFVQISPTLQATKSNYTQIHKGKKPLYLDYFLDRSRHQVLLDQLQSEQGARFLRKRNRNIIIQVTENLPIFEDFAWMTLGQIKKLIHKENVVNMDTRTVISGVPYGSYNSDVIDFYNSISTENNEEHSFKQRMLKSALDNENSLYSFDELFSWLTQLKTNYELMVNEIPLLKVKEWLKNEYEIYHKDSKYFKVIAVNVEIGNREVTRWSQPLVEPAQEGICAFIVKKINGIDHFLVQAKLECGNRDIVELAPSVQCLTGNYKDSVSGVLPFLDYVLKCPAHQIKYCCYQSEEGGRFYREQNKNLILEADEQFPTELPDNYNWMTLNQLLAFLKFNNYLNIQARSLISAINFI